MLRQFQRVKRTLVALLIAGLLNGCSGGGSTNGSSSPATTTVNEPTPPPPPATNTNNPAPEETPSPPAPSPSPPASIQTRLDQLLARYANTNGGASVSVVQAGTVVYEGGVGLANTAAAIPIRPSSGFRLASVSKSFTALAVMQLVEDQVVDLDGSILDYIHDLPESWQPITIDMLLSHRSGIVDVVSDILPSTWLQNFTNRDIVAWLTENPNLEFTPGSRAEYSNTGYILLAEVVERASGVPFGEYMVAHVFEPAGMLDSYIHDERTPLRPNDVLGYGRSNLFYGVTTFIKGGMAQVSSAEDFSHFFVAMSENRLVSADSLTLMTRNQYGTLLFGRGYGYGFMLEGSTYGDRKSVV